MRPNPATALFAVRPYVVAGVLTSAIVLLNGDRRGAVLVLGVLIAFGLVDVVVTFLRFGLRRIEVTDSTLELRYCSRRSEAIDLVAVTKVEVLPPDPRFLEYFSAAYTEYGEVVIVAAGRRESMDFLVKTPDGCARLESRLRRLVER